VDKWLDYGRYLVAAAGTALTAFLGGWDNVLQVLVILVVLDYLTGVVAAWFRKDLCSEIGAKGIAKKVFIFIMIGLAALIDRTGAIGEPIFRTLACWFYIANEGLSVIENAGDIGLPVPQPLKDALAALKAKGDKQDQGAL
jgi:toxin secretion/phage lysis holin